MSKIMMMPNLNNFQLKDLKLLIFIKTIMLTKPQVLKALFPNKLIKTHLTKKNNPTLTHILIKTLYLIL